jgi:hypothetical protein
MDKKNRKPFSTTENKGFWMFEGKAANLMQDWVRGFLGGFLRDPQGLFRVDSIQTRSEARVPTLGCYFVYFRPNKQREAKPSKL